MCGIFGFYLERNSQINWKDLLYDLYRLSESRGKEASGIAIRHQDQLYILRHDKAASDLIKTKRFTDLIKIIDIKKGDLVVMGHTRLVTNGDRAFMHHNQPSIQQGIVTIHNGIICNYQTIWKDVLHQKHPSELDTEVIPAFLSHKLQTETLEEAFKALYQIIEGDASICCLFENQNVLALQTNTGSLYYSTLRKESFVFASQNVFVKTISHKYLRSEPVHQLKPHTFKLISFNQPERVTLKDLNISQAKKNEFKRCSKCILPESFPGIYFDHEDICNYCHDYVRFYPHGRETLERLCDAHRKNDGSPDCLLAFSGGRDSSYALHYLKQELGMNPVTYTYDWGFITDLARRNISRMCGKLGVENILVSANIPQKRSYVKKNIEAWLKKPDLGMVTLFTAGDKEFFYYPKKIRREMGIDLVFFAGNRLEQTNFKSAFCGIQEKNNWYMQVTISNKLRILSYFIFNFFKNPSYFNSSVFDTLLSFYYAYLLRHDFKNFYDYIPWNEKPIMDTLKKEYNWEMETSLDITWRIGDGTTAFYNYIYLTLAGFTEHDTFRSNQIRQGMLSRDEALEMIKKDNAIRYNSIKDYANLIGIDVNKLLNRIGSEKYYKF